MKRITLLLAALTLGVGGCQPVDTPGESQASGPWNGTRLTVCGEPPSVPPGKKFGKQPHQVHILVVITADIIRIKNGREVCVPNAEIPFKIHLLGKLDGKPAIKPDRVTTLPWIADLVTPHFEHLYVPLSATGKFWEVTVHAAHETKNDVVSSSIPLTFIRCAIFVDGTRAATHSARIRIGLVAASCTASGIIGG